jgi:hypothetical protein
MTEGNKGRTGDGLVIMTNGDVEDFDPAVIQRALDAIPRKGFYQIHCVERCGNECNNCGLPACPIADQ